MSSDDGSGDAPERSGASLTPVPPTAMVVAAPRFDPEAVYKHHYARFRAALEAKPFPGFLAAVVDGESFQATWVAASETEVRAAIIGRHSRATLTLPKNEQAALRHLALLVRLSGRRPVARLMDLQTNLGFSDPNGSRHEAIAVNGATFVSVGGVVLALVPTGAASSVPPDPDAGWRALAPVHWHEGRTRARPIASPPASSPPPGATIVRTMDGPRGCSPELCRAGEIPYGMVTVSASGDETHVLVSGRALDEGFLLGRYDRCEVGGPEADESLSRVHLLVVREGRHIVAVDTASTNGTYLGDDRVHLQALTERTRLDLGGVVELTWRTCN